MTPDHDLSPYDVAYLFGGPDRVAVVALVALHADGRIRITPDRHRVHVQSKEGDLHPVEETALAVVPDVGRVLGLTRALVAASPAVARMGRRLRADGLIEGSRIGAWWHRDRIRTARSLRRELAEAPEGLVRVAVQGIPGIADDELRTIFETHVYTPPDHAPLIGPKRRRRPGPFEPNRSSINDYATDYSYGYGDSGGYGDVGGYGGWGGWDVGGCADSGGWAGGGSDGGCSDGSGGN